MEVFKRGMIAFINTTYEPYYGWYNAKPYDVGLVVATGSSHCELRFTLEHGGTYEKKVLKVVEHPYVATFTALGKGIATALLNAPCPEEAQVLAQKLINDPNATDFTGRKLHQLTWHKPVKANEEIIPVLTSVVDDLPNWMNLANIYWKGKIPT